MDVIAMALSFLVIIWQLPDKRLIFANLLFIDVATFVALAYVVITIRSGNMALVAAKASIVITIMLHLSKWIWGLRHK